MFEPDEMMMKRVFFLLLMFAHKQNMQAVRSIQAGSLNLSAFTSYPQQREYILRLLDFLFFPYLS
ncbi:hypothetical protein DERF_012240 [Dermatophagoides farinae]|uniref:Uncharacterized protein n=1 Tax=Dermatophagoides farinae TaxID=6954 RepID=A0A922L3A0_DERFA|nr:hypothetical protein DERF_012240 [Dermatophagoides farinae]